jgi:DNA-binding NtrC family response regulator
MKLLRLRGVMALILIIDDDNDVRVVLKEILAREGYDVIDAADGEEGIRLYMERSADLVITDIVMPRMEGMETIQYLYSRFPDIKIIAMSGGGRVGPESYLCLAEQFGALCALSKPIERGVLLKTVEQALA